MNIVFRLLPLIFIASVSAQECATVNFSPTYINSEEYVTVITTNNDININRNESRRSVLAHNHSYYLEPGLHSLIIQQWPLEMVRKVGLTKKTGNFKGNSEVFVHYAQLTVVKNMQYQFELVAGDKATRHITLNVKKTMSCSESLKVILTSKKTVKKTQENQKVIFPQALEYRLRLLMNKLAAFHVHDSSEAVSRHMIPTRLNTVFGTMLDNDYMDNGKAIRILSVSPYSLASRLKLFSGDKIIGLGRYKIQSDKGTTFQQLTRYLSSINFGEKIIIEIIRNGKKMTLKGIYRPSIIPEARYVFAGNIKRAVNLPLIIEHSTLPNLLSFEFDQLVVELADVLTNKGFENNLVEIVREETVDDAFGLSGKKVSVLDGIGLKVLDVKEQSVAESIGLLQQDVIVKINNKELNDHNLDDMLNSLKTMESGRLISFIVQRKSKLVKLAMSHTPYKLAGFRLTLDLDSISTLNNRLKTLERKIREDRRKVYVDKKLRPVLRYKEKLRYKAKKSSK